MNSREIKINTFRLFTFCGVTFKQISLKNNNRTLNLTERIWIKLKKFWFLFWSNISNYHWARDLDTRDFYFYEISTVPVLWMQTQCSKFSNKIDPAASERSERCENWDNIPRELHCSQQIAVVWNLLDSSVCSLLKIKFINFFSHQYLGRQALPEQPNVISVFKVASA